MKKTAPLIAFGFAALTFACTSTNSSTGEAGHGGTTGAAGTTGSSGTTGSAGTTGSGLGSAGTTGTSGTTGNSGTTGVAGTTGSAGTGSSGTTGTAGSTGGATAGTTGRGGSGAGGTATGGAGGGASGSAGSAGGASGDGWVSILPTDDKLTGWFPYVKGYTPGMDPLKTFRRDPQTGYLLITYADYPNGSFDNHLGLIYYDKKLTNYKVRVEYSFQEPQAKNPVSWGKNNSGVLVFCTDPHLITGNPDFPTGIEIQLLGSPSAGGSINCQICLNSTVSMYPAKIGTQTITQAGGCFKSTQSASDFQPASAWTTVEADVSATGTGMTNIYQYTKDGMKPATPIQTFSAPLKTGGQTVTSGWISLQSESQPCTFRKVELIELP
jgi:hypothetical protein